MEVELRRTGGAPVPGTYLFKIVDVKDSESSNGNPMIILECQVQDEGLEQGKKISIFMPLVDTMRWKLEELLDAVDAPPTGKWSTQDFRGKLFRGRVDISKKPNGDESADIKKYMKAPSGNSQESLPGGAPRRAAVPGLPTDTKSEKSGKIPF
jgi:hypothetical protein